MSCLAEGFSSFARLFLVLPPSIWHSRQYMTPFIICSVQATRWRAIARSHIVCTSIFKHGSNEKNGCDGRDDKDLERERIIKYGNHQKSAGK